MQLEKMKEAARALGLVLAIREEISDVLTLVSVRIPTMRSPEIRGVVTPVGFSVDLADVGRLTGPEKVKLKDLFTSIERYQVGA